MDNKSSISIGKHPPSKKPLPPTPGSTQTSPLTTTITSTTISSNSNSNSNSTVSSLDMDSPPAPRLPPKPMREQAKVLFAYDAQNDDELTIKEGDIITIISKEVEDQGWWKGELSGRIGVFPDNFVELIKVPVVSSGSGNTMTSSGSGNNNNLSGSGDDLSTHALRLKKPERPSEKPPPSASSAILAGSSPPMSSSIKNSLEEIMLNKSQGVNHPCLPGKKPKSSSLLSKSVVVKPDVVPVESHDSTGGQCNAYENGTSENCENNSVDGGLTGLDSSSNKLTHLTAKRAKGPKDRRPPSMLGVPKEFENGFGKENGSGHSPHHHHGGSTGDLTSTGHRKSSPPPAVGSATGSTPPNQQQQVPWVLELKKTQEKKNEEKRKATIGGGSTCNLEDSPSNTIKAFGTPNSPTKTSPNRFSGDFTSKFGGSIIHGSKDTSASLPSDHVVDQTTPTSINAPAPYKPAKAVKPVATALGSNNTKVLPSTPIGKSQLIQSTSVVDNTNTTPSSSSVGNSNSSINHVNKEVIELQNELRTLKETMVSKVDFEDLLKQCNELKELVESQKQSYGSVIKDLINDVADTRKKIATLQIEVDRLRRLTTTV